MTLSNLIPYHRPAVSYGYYPVNKNWHVLYSVTDDKGETTHRIYRHGAEVGVLDCKYTAEEINMAAWRFMERLEQEENKE